MSSADGGRSKRSGPTDLTESWWYSNCNSSGQNQVMGPLSQKAASMTRTCAPRSSHSRHQRPRGNSTISEKQDLALRGKPGSFHVESPSCKIQTFHRKDQLIRSGNKNCKFHVLQPTVGKSQLSTENSNLRWCSGSIFFSTSCSPWSCRSTRWTRNSRISRFGSNCLERSTKQRR